MACETIKNGVVGQGIPIRDAVKKVTGQTRYVADQKLPGMLHAKVLFSTVAHARIKRIDCSQALALPGVKAVLWHENTPDVRYNGTGESIDRYRTERIFDDTVRFIGDRVAAVAAVDLATAEKAVRLIRVEYEPLPVNTDPEAGMVEGAYPLFEDCGLERGNLIETIRQSCGDVDKAMAEADLVLQDEYRLPMAHHGALETHACIAEWDADGKLTLHTTSQDIFSMRQNLCRIFCLPMSKVRIRVPAMGGSFGGRVDMILEPVAAALAIRAGRPVKLAYNRREEMLSTRTRHAMKIRIKSGVKRDGTILAQDMQVYCSAGAYVGGTCNIVWSMCSKFFKILTCRNLRFTGYPVVTNTPVGGPMRGFGSPQIFFAHQRHMNRLARSLDMDPMQLQEKNLTYPDGVDYRSGQPHGNAQIRACLRQAARWLDYEGAVREQQSSAQSRYRIGVGIATGDHGNGMHGLMTDITALMLKMNDDGSCVLYTGVNDMGNSLATTQMQIVSDVLGISLERIACVAGDTELCPYQMGDFTSRGTYISAHAAVKVAQAMEEKLLHYAALLLDAPEGELCLEKDGVTRAGVHLASLGQVVQYARHKHFTELMCQVTYASEAAVTSYGAHAAKVRVDTCTGRVEVLDYAAVHDVGRPLNPLSVEGQLQGAVQMGVGYALTEDFGMDEQGQTKHAGFRAYHMPNAGQMPLRLRVGTVESLEESGPYGAKSIGECAVVPSAAALANAVSNAIGGECNQLPITPERVLWALKHAKA